MLIGDEAGFETAFFYLVYESKCVTTFYGHVCSGVVFLKAVKNKETPLFSRRNVTQIIILLRKKDDSSAALESSCDRVKSECDLRSNLREPGETSWTSGG